MHDGDVIGLVALLSIMRQTQEGKLTLPLGGGKYVQLAESFTSGNYTEAT